MFILQRRVLFSYNIISSLSMNAPESSLLGLWLLTWGTPLFGLILSLTLDTYSYFNSSLASSVSDSWASSINSSIASYVLLSSYSKNRLHYILYHHSVLYLVLMPFFVVGHLHIHLQSVSTLWIFFYRVCIISVLLVFFYFISVI